MEDKIISTQDFTMKSLSQKEMKSFLHAHLGETLIEIIKLEFPASECKVKTKDGEKNVLISMPTDYTHYK